jgi:hypothetical protein
MVVRSRGDEVGADALGELRNCSHGSTTQYNGLYKNPGMWTKGIDESPEPHDNVPRKPRLLR